MTTNRRKTLKRETAEALLEFAKRWGPKDDDREEERANAAALFAQAEYELNGGLRPKQEKDFEFEKLWELVPPPRRLGTRYESLRLYRQLRQLPDWPGGEAVRAAYWKYVESVGISHRGNPEAVQYVALLTTWLRQRRYL